MFYFVGLGNPGAQYAHTRHNVGWQALDYCLEQFSLPGAVSSAALSGRVSRGVVYGKEVTALYPETFMNNSGTAVAKLVTTQDVEQLVVLHDDVDVPFGAVRVAKGRGAGGNNGVRSIIDTLGTNAFIRVRIGIAPKSFWTGETKRPAGGGPLERFVLKEFTAREREQLPEVFAQVHIALTAILTEGVDQAMNRCN